MNDLHGVAGPLMPLVLLALAVLAALLAVRGRPPGGLDVARRVALVLVVAQAAVGLAIALRGNAPAEWIHWLYGPAIVVALLVPGSFAGSPGRRSGTLAVGALLAALLAWRLWASG